MFKCQECKALSRKGESAFRIYEFRKKVYSKDCIGFEPDSEKLVCSGCSLEQSNKKEVNHGK